MSLFSKLDSSPPEVPPSGPEGSYLIELLIYNGAPFANHWAYFVRSHTDPDPDYGVLINAAGDVLHGFAFEIERALNFKTTSNTNIPMKRIPLQWVSREFFGVDEEVLFNGGVYVLDHSPVCAFEESVYKVKVPGKSLRSTAAGDSKAPAPSRLTQRNCQTWIIESAEQLVRGGIFDSEVAAYLRSIKQ